MKKLLNRLKIWQLANRVPNNSSMEFEESPDDITGTLENLRRQQGSIEDALLPIMTGIVQRTGWMDDGA